VHHAACTVANLSDVTVTYALPHGREDCVLGDSGYIGAKVRTAIGNARDRRQHERWKRCEASMRPGMASWRVGSLQHHNLSACKGLTIPRGIKDASQ
jgi:hypothetical protein